MNPKKTPLDLDRPEYYNNRELSWLAFNERVLEEAADKNNPLLERLHFLSIFSSNLDEFFMVRVAGLLDLVEARFTKPENKTGMTPKQQLVAISTLGHLLVERLYDTYHSLKPLLSHEGIQILDFATLPKDQRAAIEQYFDEQIFPVLTPVSVDAYRPFPMLLNKSLNLAVTLTQKKDEELIDKIGIVQVPSVLPRFIPVPGSKNDLHFLLLEDIIGVFLHKLFMGCSLGPITQFRITRNADMNLLEEGAHDLLKEIEKELKKRKWGAAVRLEVRNQIDPQMLQRLLAELDIHEKDVYQVPGPLDLTFLASFYRQLKIEKEELAYEPLSPQQPQDLPLGTTLFDKVLSGDVLLHHPFESFQTVTHFLDQAAADPNVLAIKQTLYRVSGDSPIIKSLKKAAERGKQVMVLVELKARFDEENNVAWARELEQAGCHVIYGMTHLKTHSKITLVVRRQEGQIQRFVHLGTGNYNDTTANFYTDMGLVTANKKIGEDATNFFNFLSGNTAEPDYHRLSVAPYNIRHDLIDLTDKEIRFHKKSGNGHVIMKMNSLTDKPMIKKLYEASQEGVRIELIVRGICCLRPGIPGISENISVRSIVGRYLEHSRIYYFRHNGKEKIFLSSADLMTRNMEHRVEISFPIMDANLRNRIKEVLDIYLSDNVKARLQGPDGIYRHLKPKKNQPRIDSQRTLFQMAYETAASQERDLL